MLAILRKACLEPKYHSSSLFFFWDSKGCLSFWQVMCKACYLSCDLAWNEERSAYQSLVVLHTPQKFNIDTKHGHIQSRRWFFQTILLGPSMLVFRDVDGLIPPNQGWLSSTSNGLHSASPCRISWRFVLEFCLWILEGNLSQVQTHKML